MPMMLPAVRTCLRGAHNGATVFSARVRQERFVLLPPTERLDVDAAVVTMLRRSATFYSR